MPKRNKRIDKTEYTARRNYELIPAYTLDTTEMTVEVDAPDNITVLSSFNDVKENDLKLINLAATAILHGISYARTPGNLVILTRELRDLIAARRDALLMQKEREPTLHNKNNVFNHNPED